MVNQRWNKREFWLCGMLMTAGILLYSSLYLLSVYPVTEGWGIYYAELLNRGQFPYRDFFYHLPPLSLLFDWLFWKLSFGSLLVFRLWYVLQRIVMMWLLYKLLTKWIAPRYGWLACLVGAAVRASVIWDLGGDYNQTQTLFVELLIYVIVAFLEKDADAEGKGILRYKNIFFAGALIASMVLLKQSTGLAALIICLVFLVVYCIIRRDKRFLQYCLATASGAVIPLGGCVAWLACNGALTAFLEQFFGAANSKGGIGTILFAGWQVVLNGWVYIVLFAAAALALWSSVLAVNKKGTVPVALGHWLLFVALCWANYGEPIRGMLVVLTSSQTWYVFLLIMAISVAFTAKFKSKYIRAGNEDTMSTWLSAALFALGFAIIRLNVGDIGANLYENTNLHADIPTILTYFSIYAALIAVVVEFRNYRQHGKFRHGKALIFLFVGGLIDAYANMMNASNVVYPTTAFILVPALIVLVFSLDMGHWTKTKNAMVCTLCVFACCCCMIQKHTTGYSWWGSEMTDPLHERTTAVEIDAMAGLRLSEQKALELEKVTKLIQENDDEDSTVWGFPHVKIFNILTGHYDVTDPVPVLFYDVCSDQAAEKEVAWLEENPPDFVIWCDLPGCLETHEMAFRNGEPLGQREIVEWFTEAREDDYVKIGQVGKLHVYKLDDGTPVKYEYFQTEGSLNITAGETD